MRLLVDRACLRLPGFELTGENAEAVGSICRKLDGMPLAIELAAARMGAFAVDQIAGRLDDSLKLLTGGGRTVEPRQRTLRATLDWSHDLLGEPEQALFRRLSAFAGGWTLDAAEAVCSGEGMERESVLASLVRLVDKSLVVAEAPSKAAADLRYRMLVPVRQYAREKLEDSGEAERFRRRHAEYYLAFAEETDAGHTEVIDVREWRSAAWLERVEGEHGNFGAALNWSLDEDVEPDQRRAELGLRMAVVLFPFWHVHMTEGRLYLEQAVGMRSDPTTIRWKARALHGASWLAGFRGDHGEATIFAQEALAIFREIGDREGVAASLTQLGMEAVLGQRDEIPLPVVLDELVQLKPALRNCTTLGWLLVLEGLVALGGTDLDRSETLHEEALGLFRELRDAPGMLGCLIHLSAIAFARGDYGEVMPLLREALSLGIETNNYASIQICLHTLACLAAHRAQPVRAARLWGAVEGMQASLGLHLTPFTYAVTGYEAFLAGTRSQVEEEVWSQAWAEGKAMPLERALEYALSEQDALDPSASGEESPDREPPERLTRREREVALLVERGLTNREISSELSISERTVENHVRNVLKKLDFSSRAQIAAWIAHQR